MAAERRVDDTALLARTPEGEACLIGRIAGGDRLAFEALYRAYFPRLGRFLQRMTRHTTLIEEIVNDTLLVVWRKADTFNGTSKVSTWVFAIAYRRACKALQAFDEPVEDSIAEREGLASDRPEWQFERLRLAQAVDGALAALPLAQRTAFQLAIAVLAVLLWRPAGAPDADYRVLGASPGVQGSLIATFKPDTPERELRRIVRASGAHISGGPTATGAWLLGTDQAPATVAARLRAEPAVTLAEPLGTEGQP